MHGSRWLRVVGTLAALATVLTAIFSAGATEPEPGPFEHTWERTDLPVQTGQANRTWVWAPSAITAGRMEPYAESPGGMREVQYFDKSRMELTNPDGDPESPWHVTNGLLVLEMVEGYIQTGNETHEPYPPSTLPVAGDLEGTSAPSYTTIAALIDLAPADEGAQVIRRADASGNVSEDPELAAYGVTEGPSAAEHGRNHRTASVFWAFMTSTGTVWDGSAYVTDRLFSNAYYGTGLPIAPPFWARVEVGGTPKDVLTQCFERRCLTFTPDNPEGWQVEAGNVGLHYLNWRYPEDGEPTPTEPGDGSPQSSTSTAEPTEPGASPTATGTSPANPTVTPSATEGEDPPPLPTNTATATATATSTATATATATATTPSGGGQAAACLNATEAAFLNLINQYRASHELGPLAASRSLNIASYNHSLDMSENNYFSHTSQNGDSLWDRMADAGYDYNTHKGENIAMGYQTAQAVFDGWKNSPGHNANMLNPNFDAIGIGYVSSGHYWTTDFGGYVDAAPSC